MAECFYRIIERHGCASVLFHERFDHFLYRRLVVFVDDEVMTSSAMFVDRSAMHSRLRAMSRRRKAHLTMVGSADM